MPLSNFVSWEVFPKMTPYFMIFQAHLCDVISVNRHYGWHSYPGKLDQIHRALETDLRSWFTLHSKPLIMIGYGGGAQAGFHSVSDWILLNRFLQKKQNPTLQTSAYRLLTDAGL